MLLHKIDSWGSASVLHAFSKFSKVAAFKPASKHATRSSFYMIAKEVDPMHPAAIASVNHWKEAWCKCRLWPFIFSLSGQFSEFEALNSLLTYSKYFYFKLY
jgi:hypothetical protein